MLQEQVNLKSNRANGHFYPSVAWHLALFYYLLCMHTTSSPILVYLYNTVQ